MAPTRYPSGITNRSGDHPMYQLPVIDPTRHLVFFDDFTTATISAAGVTGWHGDATGTNVALAVTDAHGGIATTETGSSANDSSNYQWGTNTTVHEPFKLQAGRKAWLRVRLKTEDADQDAFHAGLHIAADDATATEPTDQFMFRSVLATPAAIQFAVGKTASTEVTASLGNMADDTFTILSAYYDGKDTVHVWRESSDGVITNTGSCTVTSSTAGDLLPDTEMTVGFGIECIDTGADLLTLDYILVVVER